MNVCISYDDKFEVLANLACSELIKANNIVHMNKIIREFPSQDGFGSKKWYECIRAKIEFAQKIFDTIDEDDCLCVSDSDIYYINSKSIFDLEQYLQNHFLDFVFPKENLKHDIDDINCGFFVIRKSETTRDFFDIILSNNLYNFKYADQDLINNYIKKNNIRYELLDPQSYVMGCYMNSVPSIVKEKLVLLHTTCATNFWEKIGQIVSFNHRFQLPLIKWIDSYDDSIYTKHYTNGAKIDG